MAPDFLKPVLKTLPESPGVYRYYGQGDEIIYIGKAKNLKKRVSSYFNKLTHERFKTQVLVSKILRIEYTVVDTEYDALILENILIKQYKPRYNVNLKDDKSYPYIVVTAERFPRVFPTYQLKKGKNMYFGPYTNTRMMYVVLDLIKQLYPIRNCNYYLSEKNVAEKKFRLCLEYHIGNCKGPCVGLQSEEEYDVQVRNIKHLLKGNLNEIKVHLRSQIEALARSFKYEEAHLYKLKLEAVEKYRHRSTIVSPVIHNVEVMCVRNDPKRAFVNYMKVNNGMIVVSRNLEFKKRMDESDEELIMWALADIRNHAEVEVEELILPFMPNWSGLNCKVTVPKVGDKKKLLDLSIKNVLAYRKAKLQQAEHFDPALKIERILLQLQKDLCLSALPVHMECFDNSNLQGTNPASACVVFKDAKPSKKDYRMFNIKHVVGPDDFASMREVVRRRYARLIEEKQDLPQLIVIDGGKGQLSAAVDALKALNLYGKIAVVGIAKRLEEIYFPSDSDPLFLDKKSSSLKLIQHMRDEAHRFSLKHHRNRRSKSMLANPLLELDGVGPKTLEKLLLHFKSVKKLEAASQNEIEKVVGKKLAAQITLFYQKKTEV